MLPFAAQVTNINSSRSHFLKAQETPFDTHTSSRNLGSSLT